MSSGDRSGTSEPISFVRFRAVPEFLEIQRHREIFAPDRPMQVERDTPVRANQVVLGFGVEVGGEPPFGNVPATVPKLRQHRHGPRHVRRRNQQIKIVEIAQAQFPITAGCQHRPLERDASDFLPTEGSHHLAKFHCEEHSPLFVVAKPILQIRRDRGRDVHRSIGKDHRRQQRHDAV